MYNVYFDSGTSNTRAYLLNDYVVVDEIKKNIGSKDSSISGSNAVLLMALKELYDMLLVKNGLEDTGISGIYASGMITCPFGVKEVPHLTTPVSVEKLYNGIYVHYESEYLKRNINLIRGAKTIDEGFTATLDNIPDVNNMRGEEIEIFGVLSELSDDLKFGSIALFLPGSHTHVAYIKSGALQDMLSTFSGELFYAISKDTILSSSVQSENDGLDEEAVLLGYKHLKEKGFNRALYMVHATKIFNACDNFRRRSYLEGVITGGVILAFQNAVKSKWGNLDRVLVVGNNSVSKVYEILLKGANLDTGVDTLIASGKQSYAVKGFIELLKRGGAL